MKKTILLGVALMGMMACNGQEKSTQESNTEGAPTSETAQINENIDVNAFAAGIEAENVVILDVRTPEEYNEGHLEGSIHINIFDADFQQRVAELDKDVPVYVYCRSGGRSGKAAGMMNQMGFSAVYNLVGGITAWEAETKPIEK